MLRKEFVCISKDSIFVEEQIFNVIDVVQRLAGEKIYILKAIVWVNQFNQGYAKEAYAVTEQELLENFKEVRNKEIIDIVIRKEQMVITEEIDNLIVTIQKRA